MISPQGVGVGVGGVNKLSQLIIDTDKDWGKYNITNFGSGGVDLYSMLTAHASRHAYGGADAIPARGIARSQLEYPTVDVSFAYLIAINKHQFTGEGTDAAGFITLDSFSDKAVEGLLFDDQKVLTARTNIAVTTYYNICIDSPSTAADFRLNRFINGVGTLLASEAVDLGTNYHATCKLSCSGSVLKAYRVDLTIPRMSATDTNIASGYFGTVSGFNKMPALPPADFLRAPSSPLPPAQSIIEVNLEGSGKSEDPFRPSPSRNLAEITSLTGLPDFLYQEAKKYSILKAKGFTDEEIQLLFGYIPQHQVDLDAVTWGAFELHPDKAPTAVVVITGDNPYKSGAILRQIDFARGKNLRVFSPPRDYNEAVALYNQLSRDYPHWLAGKDNFAYQTLGWEILDWMQNVDFYYGELLDHKTHYQQLKQVSDKEITGRLNELIDKLSKGTALVDERDKHISKAKEILKKGW
jgi:hypothetical protein